MWRRLFISLIFISLLVHISDAKINDCEQVAKEYAARYHMGITFVQFVDPDGAYIFDGKNGAHILNTKIIQGHRYYFDFSIQSGAVILNSKEAVVEYYKEHRGYDNEVYNIGVDTVPFPIQWDD
jgi:hypothetical protein